jgi:YVTN family beta-propeller protein
MRWSGKKVVRRRAARTTMAAAAVVGIAGAVSLTATTAGAASGPTLNKVATITPVTSPSLMSYDSANGYTYVPNEVSSGTVTVIDPATNKVVTTVTGMGTNPVETVVDASTNTIYVLDQSGGNFYTIDGATNTPSGPFSLYGTGTAGQEGGGTIDTANNTLYVAGGNQTGNIEAVDMSNNTVAATFAPSGNASDTLFAPKYDSANSTLYVYDMSNNTLYAIDPSTNKVTGSTAMPSSADVIWMTLNSTGSTLYISSAVANEITVVSTSGTLSSASITGHIAVTYPYQSALVNGYLYVDEATAAKVAIIDTSNNLVVNTVPTTSGSEPVSMAYTGSEFLVGELVTNDVLAFTTGAAAPSCTSNAGGSGTVGSNNECLNLAAGALSVGSVTNGTITGTVAGTTSGALPGATWADTTGSGAGWNGTLAMSSFTYTGAWNTTSGSDALANTSAGAYTGTADGLTITVTVGSGATTSNTPFTWSDNQGGSGTGTATNGTPAAVAQGVTIDFSSSTAYASGDAFLVECGTQSTSALELDTAATGAGITAGTLVTSPSPTFENNATAVTGGGPATLGTAVPMLTAAATDGMGSYTVVPGASVTTDSNSWAATYTAQAQYSIATGP